MMPDQWILKGDKDNKYVLYIEAYVLDYIKKRESVSDLFLYGTRQVGERKCLMIYGVSYTAQDDISFAPYKIIRNLQIRKESIDEKETIIFEMQEANRLYTIKGYYIFYEDNPVMKQWLVREHGYAPRPALEACEIPSVSVPRIKRKQRREKGLPETIVDFGLIAILLMLLSVVIDTLNSPLKMGGFVQHLQQIQKMLMR